MLMKFLLEKLTEDIRPQLAIKHCLHFKNRLKSCTICQDACPHQAITTTRAAIKIDENRCKGCGSCRGLCPTQALTLKGFSLERLITEAAKKPKVILGCSQEGNKGNLSVPCLRGMTVEDYITLAILSGKREIFLNRTQCHHCEHMNQEWNDEILHRAQELGRALGIEIVIHAVDSEGESLQIPQPELTRRELFSFFKRETTQMAGRAIDHVAEEFVGERNQRQINRNLFLGALKALKLSDNTVIPSELASINAWRVDAACNGCGLCQGVCPGQAWQVKKESESITVSHGPGRCVGCGLCQELCPQSAIKEDVLKISKLEGFYLMKALSKRQCSQCEASFFNSEDDSEAEIFCLKCKKEQEIKGAVN